MHKTLDMDGSQNDRRYYHRDNAWLLHLPGTLSRLEVHQAARPALEGVEDGEAIIRGSGTEEEGGTMKLLRRIQRFFAWEESDEEYLDNITAGMSSEAFSIEQKRIDRWKNDRTKEPYQ